MRNQLLIKVYLYVDKIRGVMVLWWACRTCNQDGPGSSLGLGATDYHKVSLHKAFTRRRPRKPIRSSLNKGSIDWYQLRLAGNRSQCGYGGGGGAWLVNLQAVGVIVCAAPQIVLTVFSHLLKAAAVQVLSTYERRYLSTEFTLQPLT